MRKMTASGAKWSVMMPEKMRSTGSVCQQAPLFVLQGRNDPRVPYTESEQIVKALKDRQRPVEYILFEDEGHGFVKLNNRLRMYPQIVEFLKKYMKPKS